MVENRLTAWLRPVVTFFALAGLLSLAACGGGGGAPAGSPYNPAVIPTTLTVLPTATTAYSGVPSTVTITSGTGPFQVFSSNPAILPVPQTTSGPTIPLLAAQVNANTAVTLTIQDATGQQAQVAVTVSPSLLLPASITITGNPTCSASGATLCSGQDGTATVVVT